ncbi:tail tape measure protein [Flavobacterium phage FPSV-D15]|nr:tail tape measure protein [Flavobacterium phage FPSV-D15]QCW20792.1 tail tape measure protein [Flavobacterium phage FPSV-D35]
MIFCVVNLTKFTTMAKTLSDEDIKLNIIINGNTAQKELFDLEKSTRKLTEENKGLLLQKRLLEKQGKQESEQYKLLTATIKENSSSINQNKIKINELQKEIGITGLTMKQLSDRANVLKISLRNAIPGGEAHQKYTAELKEITGRINELNGKAKTAGFSISSMADSFNKYSALGATVIAGLTGVVLSVQKIIDINGKLSDAQADVSKTTGMTKTEVDDLTKSFGLLKTRTQRIDLLGIAAVGGELNIAKGEILDFVKVMDKAGVALGDSFEGGPEEVATKLGKIKNLYSELKDTGVELAFESVGSALNDLGADGNATAQNVAEFVTRVGTIPESFKPSIAVALGLGAAFEETGLKAEVAAGNYGKVIGIAANNVEGFAKVMKRPRKEIEDLINTNPNEFFLQFSKSISSLKPVDLAKVLDSLKLNDNEVKQVISAAGNNVDLFRQKIELANKSLGDGTSMTDEFNIKNNTLAATLEKISKKINGWFSSETINNWLTVMVVGFANLIGVTDNVDNSSKKWRNTLVFTAKIIAVVTSALITNAGWQKLVALWTTRNTEATLLYNVAAKARAFAEGVSMVASQAYAGVMMLLGGNVAGATQAFRVMTSVMMTTPWGFILGAIAAIGSAYLIFSDSAKEAATAQSMMVEIQNEVAKSVSNEKREIEALVKIAQDETVSKERKEKAIKRLIEISPEYLKGLTLENIKTFEGKKLLDSYIDSLYKKARATAIANKMDKLEGDKLDVESKTSKNYNGWADNASEAIFSSMGIETKHLKNRSEVEDTVAKILNIQNKNIKKYIKKDTGEILKYSNEEYTKLVNELMALSGLDQKEKEIRDIEGQQNALKSEYEKSLTDSLVTKVAPDDSPLNTPAGTGGKAKAEKKDPNSSDEEIARLKYEDDAKYKDLLLKAQRQFEDDKLASMVDGYEKELLIEKQRYQREISDLEKQKVHTDEIVKLDSDIAKAKAAKDIKLYNALIERKKVWKERNLLLDEQINKIEEGKLSLHNLKLGKIEDDAVIKKLADSKKAYDREKALRETEFIDELNGITTLADAKKKLSGTISDFELGKIKTLADAKKELQEQFAAKELAKQKEHLEDLVAQLNTIMTSKSFKGIDLEFLTPEMREEFAKQIEELKLKIAELQAVIDGKGGGKGKTPEQQAAEKKERIKKIVSDAQAIVSALMNTWGAYYDYMAAKENAQLKIFTAGADRKKLALKKQLDAGYINQAKYNRKVAQIDKELDDKKFEIELKQAKRKKSMDIVNTIINTATAIMQAYAQMGVIGGTIAGVLITAMGALQISTIANTPLPVRGYEDGLYPEEVTRQQDGKKFRSTGTSKMQTGLFTKPRILVGEGAGDMPEMVIDKRSYAQISPEVKQALIRELHGVRGFENGYYKNDILYSGNTTSTAPIPASNNNDKVLEMAMVMMSEHISLMKDLRENGIEANVSNKNLKSMKNLKEGISDFDALRNKNKH